MQMAVVIDHHQQQPQQHPPPHPPPPPQSPPFKHHCRVCKKGFTCGRALGGHMRAHGINDDTTPPLDDDDDGDGDWDEDSDNAKLTGHRMYSLRSNPNRPKTCRSCQNCGKDFSSWKSFLEHGKCDGDEDDDDDDGDINININAGGGDHNDDSVASGWTSDGGWNEDDGIAGGGWSKGKRSRRTSRCPNACPSSEDEDLANCLVMLSAARVDRAAAVETEESCASASKDEDRAAAAAAAAAHHGAVVNWTVAVPVAVKPPPAPRGVFECKACKKVFPSHQALGGHRASHKKVKGCFAAKLDDACRIDQAPPQEAAAYHINYANNNSLLAISEAAGSMAIVPFEHRGAATWEASGPPRKKAKVHECSICHRVFTSGQALGGHKRCHWLTGASSSSETASAAARGGHHHELLVQSRSLLEKPEKLDLNLPAPADDIAGELTLDVPAATATLYLQPWSDQNSNRRTNIASNTYSNNDNNIVVNNTTNSVHDVEGEEGDSKAKLSELKEDMVMGGEPSSPWLQVGIGSGTSCANDQES